MKGLWIVVILAVLFAGGCESFLPGLTDSTDLEEMRALAEAKRDTTLATSTPANISPTGEGNVVIGDKAVKEMAQVLKYQNTSSEEREAERVTERESSLTIVGYAVGGGFLLLVIVLALKYFGLEAPAKRAVQKGAAEIEKAIKKWVAVRDNADTTAETRAKANERISELNSVRSDMG